MLILTKIAFMNLALSSDNVLMIAMTSKHLPSRQRIVALLWSMAVSLVIQLLVLFVVSFLFRFKVLQVLFGIVICYMAFRLLSHSPSQRRDYDTNGVSRSVWKIAVANLLMSFENEVALIALASGNALLAWFGMLITAPFIFLGSHAISYILTKYTFIVYAAAVYLFHIGLNLFFSLPVLRAYVDAGSWGLTGAFAAFAVYAFVQRRTKSSFGRYA